MRILLVSLDLGAPVDVRGIFNYTCGIVEMLKRLGHQVDLLVQPPEGDLFDQVTENQLGCDAYQAYAIGMMAELIKYRRSKSFKVEWEYRHRPFQELVRTSPHLADFALELVDFQNRRGQVRVAWNEAFRARYRTRSDTAYLHLFDAVVAHRAVYDESMRRARNNLAPVIIDASGYDWVLYDAPHHITHVGPKPERTICVVHDFIPLFDLDMGPESTTTFARRLDTARQTARSFIFDSQAIEQEAQTVIGSANIGRSAVVYPPVREDLLDTRHRPDLKRSSQQIYSEILPDRLPIGWNHSLPYVCTAVSDEPRKNIRAFVEASKSFRDQLNFVVLGKVNPAKYVDPAATDNTNLSFTGFVSDEDKLALLASARGFIFGSFEEGFGIPIVEAYAFGLPVICSDIPVFREVTKSHARFFQPESVQELCAAISNLLASPQSASEGARTAHGISSLYTLETMTARVAELLKE